MLLFSLFDKFINILTVNAFDNSAYPQNNLIKPFGINLSIIVRLFLRHILFRDVKVNIPKRTLLRLKKYLAKYQLLLIPSHTFIIETLPIYELFGKINKPFYLMVAREFFDLAFGFVKYPLQFSGCFSVLRGDNSAKESLDFAIKILSTTNKTLILFPEGECSLNLKSTLPSKKGAAILINEMNKLGKEVAILPVGFKFIQEESAIPYLEYEILQLEKKIVTYSKEPDYKNRILNLLETLCEDYLNILNCPIPDEVLLVKINVLYQVIRLYFEKKYLCSFYEERKYEIFLKRLLNDTKDPGLRKSIQFDINLVHTWIEWKGLTGYIPNPNEENIAVWAGLIAKLMRITYKDYSHKPVQKITKFLTIEPVLHKPILCSSFKDNTLDEIQSKLDEILSDFTYWLV